MSNEIDNSIDCVGCLSLCEKPSDEIVVGYFAYRNPLNDNDIVATEIFKGKNKHSFIFNFHGKNVECTIDDVEVTPVMEDVKSLFEEYAVENCVGVVFIDDKVLTFDTFDIIANEFAYIIEPLPLKIQAVISY